MTDAVLDLIDLDQKREGYRQFLCCWTYQSGGKTFLIDPGPSSTIDYLVSALSEIGVTKVDCVLLTHIHIDHGGGVSKLLETFPDAKVFCHDSGVKHVVDPSKLWRGSVNVLRDVAEMYGEPGPVSDANMVDGDYVQGLGVKIIETPGHAAHHVSFLIDDVLFAGEAIGTRLELKSGMPYLRQATPPKFVLELALESLDRLLALETEPRWVAFAHYGLATEPFTWCRRAKKQLMVWVETLRELLEESPDNLEELFFKRLMTIDPLYGRGRFDELDEDLKKRERNFLANTMDGMVEYIQSNAAGFR